MCCTQDEYVYMGVCSCHSLECNCLYRKERWGDMIEVHEKENVTDDKNMGIISGCFNNGEIMWRDCITLPGPITEQALLMLCRKPWTFPWPRSRCFFHHLAIARSSLSVFWRKNQRGNQPGPSRAALGGLAVMGGAVASSDSGRAPYLGPGKVCWYNSSK